MLDSRKHPTTKSSGSAADLRVGGEDATHSRSTTNDRVVLTPDSIRTLLKQSGTIETFADRGGAIRVETFHLEESRVYDSNKSCSDDVRRHYRALMKDPDKYSEKKGVRDSDFAQVTRTEILPVMMATTVGLLGEKLDRGETGFDILCRALHGPGEERVQIKLVRDHSPLVHPDTPDGRKQFLKLVALLTRGARVDSDCVLLVQDGVSDSALKDLVQRLADWGVRSSQIRVLSRSLRELFGISFLDQKEEFRHLLCRITVAQRNRAMLAEVALHATAQISPKCDSELSERPALPAAVVGVLRAAGIFALAKKIEAARTEFVPKEPVVIKTSGAQNGVQSRKKPS